MIDVRDPRFPTGRDPRDARDPRDGRDPRDPRDTFGRDEMDIDPPTTRIISSFLPGEGISREVIQADICRYLGREATCLATVRDGVQGYHIRAYRMLTPSMIEDLIVDTKRWDEEVSRSRRTRGARPVYEQTDIRDRRHNTDPTQASPGYSGPHTSMHDPDDFMDDYPRSVPAPSRSLFTTSMAQDYLPSYPMTTSPFQNPSMTAPQDYMVARGPTDIYNQVPRTGHEFYPPGAAGRGTLLQPNPGQFAPQQGLPGTAPYQDPRTGQMIYPPTAGRGFEQPSRNTNPTEGRRR